MEIAETVDTEEAVPKVDSEAPSRNDPPPYGLVRRTNPLELRSRLGRCMGSRRGCHVRIVAL